ncbi:MocR-like pyridoxine biosynthesis transcription factor PdxR [Phytomonospora endophytica]|uniref:GntR family transcriptional regulator/MocR family aminotransferase n=1 Tax=Phytomonospora endophytica TaxID=714109 RepID=A0A841FAU8_9ACTN|nr:PLP-dependent aminotransferase family protein [Phytomonospora endophytica]MBB6034391.1 GntR family transcriptional regulator/MocR family aminotransferase [Phytomonospora endophytica]GIG66785.1 GntR family transcriptional regulator [Phytomonospora endophytica]
MAENQTDSLAGELPIELRRDVPVPLYRQIAAAIRGRVRAGALPPGTALPPTRVIAADLGVSRGVVVEAYAQLTAEGYLTARSGGYTRVAMGAHIPVAPPEPDPPPAYRHDFTYGRADLAGFPRLPWLRSLRRVLTSAPTRRFAPPDGRGAPALRAALADYLNRVRGTVADPRNIVVTSGFAQGVRLLTEVLAGSGATRVAVEDPSPDDDARPAAARAGLETVGIGVDEDGLLVDGLNGLRADALFLTPSHQWPVGGVLPAARRAAVVRWARERDALIVEDDYDAEYRFDRVPVGAMQGLAPDHVVYAGTLSKTLAPGVRIGWLVLPPRLTAKVAAAKAAADRGSATLEQLAFADFLERGEFDRHTRRMRRVYQSRRRVLLDALRTHLPDTRPSGADAGLHLLVWLPEGLGEEAVTAAAAELGVCVQPLGPFRLGSRQSSPGGLILGYAALDERAIAEGVALLGRAVARLRRRSGREVVPVP